MKVLFLAASCLMVGLSGGASALATHEQRGTDTPQVVVGGGEYTETWVDCSAGDDLGEVLLRKSYLRIHVTGICSGNFTVEADHVEILGDGPDSAILRGTARNEAGNPTAATLVVEGATDVVVSDLALEGGLMGLVIRRSRARLQNVTMRDNNEYGVFADNAANLRMEQVTVGAHSFSGIGAFNGTQIRLIDSDVSGSPYGLLAQMDADITIHSSKMEGSDTGIYLYRSFAIAFDSSIEGSNYGAIVADKAELELRDASSVAGGMWGIYQDADSHVESYQFSRIAGTYWSMVGYRGSLANLYDSILEGPIYWGFFGGLYMYNDNIDGFLYCEQAQGAACYDTSITEWVNCPGNCSQAAATEETEFALPPLPDPRDLDPIE